VHKARLGQAPGRYLPGAGIFAAAIALIGAASAAADSSTNSPDASAASAAPAAVVKIASAAPAPTVVAQSGAAPTVVAQRNGEPAAQIQEVKVSARRRVEKAQDVPIPITTLNGDTLDRQGTFRLEDLDQKLPSSNFLFTNPRQTSLSVRGLGNNPANDALESSVGVYLDNVYLGRPGMANIDLIDLDQVALLRGPQGTLFGKNTTAGVLNLSTKLPTFTPEAVGEVSTGSFGYFQARGAISGPIDSGKKLAARLSFVDSYSEGFVNDVTTGGRYNGFNRKGLRGQVLYQPSDNFSLRVIGDFNHELSSCCVSALTSFGPNVKLPNGSVGPALPYYLALAGATTERLDPTYRTAWINDKQQMQVNQGGASAEANWTLPSGYKLTSISAYRSWGFLPSNDADGSSVTALPDAGQGVDDKQFSQELRLASPSGRSIEYVAGLYYFFQNQGNRLFSQYGPKAGLFYGAPALNNLFTQTRAYLTTDSTAAFGQATWHATEALSLTGGVRETYESKSFRLIRDEATQAGVPDPKVMPAYDSQPLSLYNYDLSGLISADYKFDRKLLGYISFAHGAKAGGINPQVPAAGLGTASLFISPEKANDAELGFKSTLLGRRVTFNADAFWTLVKDYQATTLIQTSPGVFVQTLSNVGYVRTQGLETELQAIPLRGLTLALTASYNDAIYRSYTNAPCSAEAAANSIGSCHLTATYAVAGAQNLSHSPVTGAPRWIVNPSVTLDHRLVDDFRGYAIAQWAWRSSFFGAPDNSRYSDIAAYGIANFRLGVTKEIGDRLYADVSVFANNAFDKSYTPGGLGTGSYLSYAQFPGPPRVIGATVRLGL
jgi:iron complex outermembrane receptor protein